MRELNSIPVFGFQWKGCCYHYHDPADVEGDEAEEQDSSWQAETEKRCFSAVVEKGLSCIPIVSLFVNSDIGKGIKILNGTAPDTYEIEYPKIKAAAFITRGVITALGGGILFLLIDVIVTIGRIATNFFRQCSSSEGSSSPEGLSDL